MSVLESAGIIFEKLAAINKIVYPNSPIQTALELAAHFSSLLNQLIKSNEEAQIKIEEQLRDLDSKVSALSWYISEQGKAYFKTGVSYLEQVENYSSQNERKASIRQARGDFMHATSIEKGLMQAMAWVGVGTCSDLLKEEKTALAQYKKAYDIAYRNESLQSLLESPDIKIVPRNPRPSKLQLQTSKDEEAAFQKKTHEAEQVVQFLELLLKQLLIPRGVYGPTSGKMELSRLGQFRQMIAMRKFLYGGSPLQSRRGGLRLTFKPEGQQEG